jgi:hypothetical protein
LSPNTREFIAPFALCKEPRIPIFAAVSQIMKIPAGGARIREGKRSQESHTEGLRSDTVSNGNPGIF